MVKISVVFSGIRKFIAYRNLGKSADILSSNKGIVSTFFVCKKLNFGCRDPPFINSNNLDFELIG